MPSLMFSVHVNPCQCYWYPWNSPAVSIPFPNHLCTSLHIYQQRHSSQYLLFSLFFFHMLFVIFVMTKSPCAAWAVSQLLVLSTQSSDGYVYWHQPALVVIADSSKHMYIYKWQRKAQQSLWSKLIELSYIPKVTMWMTI